MLTSSKFRNSQRLQAAANNAPLLKSPEQGEAVRLLQEALLSLGYSFPQSTTGGRLDGIFGNETIQKVAQFQRAQSLMADGVAGKQTLQKLDALISGSPGAGQAGGAGAGWGQQVGGGGGQSGAGGGWGKRVGGGGGQGGGPQTGGGRAPGLDPSVAAQFLRVGAVLMCPHRGIITASAIPGTDLISGRIGGRINGCQGSNIQGPPVPDMYGRPGPPGYIVCTQVQWTGADYQHMVNGHPPVRRASAGMCCSSGGAANGVVVVASG